jgi:HPt (histidine-containing phosphotransfer) domain-containing protein
MERMRAAIQSGDAGALGMAAHTLKGSLLQIGETAARAQAQRIEAMAARSELAEASRLLEGLTLEMQHITDSIRGELK